MPGSFVLLVSFLKCLLWINTGSGRVLCAESSPRNKDVLPGGEKMVGRLEGAQGAEKWQLQCCSCVEKIETHC